MGIDVVNALRERGGRVEFIQFEAEGHSFKDMENLTQSYDHLEDFLKVHLQ